MRLKKQTLAAIVALAFSLAGCSTPSSNPAPAGTAPSASQGTSSDPIRLVDLPRKPGSDRTIRTGEYKATGSHPCFDGQETHVEIVDEA
ncbi:hypothetical protein [Arthrobacter sp. ZGTC131]|uniref:hypothetical protein n=1 Tax=Arthrobacter sp. ZGTC131 TaxID=2058898 RepID=UPI000CE4FDCA|nr:hypothetical protein [Arthrobacter sp. ZGTC131]